MVSTRSRAVLAAPSRQEPAMPIKLSHADVTEPGCGRGRSTSPPRAPPLPASVQTTPVDDYERCRDQRIKENLERMKKLGIFDLSLLIKSHLKTPASSTPRKRKLASAPAPAPAGTFKPPPPPRRSSRLQNVIPVIYCEIDTRRGEKTDKICSINLEKGVREEVYTDEHDKLLGTCEMDWTLFVDGYDKNGKRIYDPVNGKTCHQCRQKTLGLRTRCCKCNLVQGQFCGDCLYMRYGENVLEANKNPNWICPVCRGICNCSLCRIKNGWVPTGSLYKKVVSLEYKSVAHYLIQTRRSPSNSGDLSPTKPVSSKKTLTFDDPEVSSHPESAELDRTKSECDVGLKDCCNGQNEKAAHSSDENGITNVVAETTIKPLRQSKEENEATRDAEQNPTGKKENSAANATSPESIAGRLRKRHKP